MENSSKVSRLDQIDWRILRIIRADGRISVTALAGRVGLSKSPCQVRLKRLQEEGFILGFQAVLSPQLLRQEHVAFTEVKLHDTTETALGEFNAAVREIPEIEQCHMIAGPFDYLLKVRASDINAYRRLLGEKISALPHVASTSTYVSMEAVKDGGFAGPRVEGAPISREAGGSGTGPVALKSSD